MEILPGPPAAIHGNTVVWVSGRRFTVIGALHVCPRSLLTANIVSVPCSEGIRSVQTTYTLLALSTAATVNESKVFGRLEAAATGCTSVSGFVGTTSAPLSIRVTITLSGLPIVL